MHTKVPDAADKHKMDVVIYEIDMVNSLYNLINKQESIILNNAILESFLIHVRALTNFFEGNKKYSDDLTCLDFRNRVEGNSRPQALAFDEDFRRSLDKSVAHITTRRLDYKSVWDLLSIRHEINKAAYAFLSSCSPEEFPSEENRIQYISQFEQAYKA